MHFAPAQHTEGIGAVGFFHPQGHITQQFPHQAVTDLAGGDEFSFPAGKGAVVHREDHFHSGFGDLYKRHSFHSGGVAHGVADVDAGDAGEGHNVSAGGLGHRHPLQAFKLVHGDDLGFVGYIGIVIIHHSHFLVLAQLAPFNAANGDTAHIVVIVDGGDQHLGGAFHIFRGIDVAQDGFKQGHQIAAGVVGGQGSSTLTAGAEDDGGFDLLFGGVQIQQQLQHFVHHFQRTGVGAVYFVDHHDDLVAQFQRLLQDKTGLGHGAFKGVYQQKDTVHHFQHPFHFAAEVGVAGGVDDVDLYILIVDRGVLGQDGDTTLPFDGIVVHHPVLHGLVFTESAALFEHFVHQGGFAVVDMGDNGDVAQIVSQQVCHSSKENKITERAEDVLRAILTNNYITAPGYLHPFFQKSSQKYSE